MPGIQHEVLSGGREPARGGSHSAHDAGRAGELGEHRLVKAARDRAEQLLGGMGTRWQHTCGVAARFTATDRCLDDEMAAFDDPRSWTGRLADALTTADQTTSPDGRPMDVETRLADMLRRHGPDSPQARVHHLRAPVVRAAVAQTERRLIAVPASAGFG